MNEPKALQSGYHNLITVIGQSLVEGKSKAFTAVNTALVQTYWNVGKHIVEFEQQGNEKAVYGSKLLRQLSIDLKKQHGKGFSLSNLQYMRLLYVKYPIYQTLSGKLSWSHYLELLSISDDLARSFYKQQCIKENWSVRELDRQRTTSLFERIALSKDKAGVLELSKNGQLTSTATDILKDPYVFEFLEASETKLRETELENQLVNKLENFLLELGKGFAFIGQQYRITLNNTHFYVDLVFYHRILKCFVLIDLKTTKVDHQDVGQMNMYLNYFKAEENVEGDNDPIGIVLATAKDEVLVKYATGSISNQLFVSKYQLYLPDVEALERELRLLMESENKTEK